MKWPTAYTYSMESLGPQDGHSDRDIPGAHAIPCEAPGFGGKTHFNPSSLVAAEIFVLRRRSGRGIYVSPLKRVIIAQRQSYSAIFSQERTKA